MTKAEELAEEIENQKHKGTRPGSKEEAADEMRRLSKIEAASVKVVTAFEALGNAHNAGSMLMERGNCEMAMVALKAALFNTEIGGASPPHLPS